VVGVEDEAAGEVVVAFVVAADAELTGSELRQFCSERIAAFKVPARVHLVDQLPATDTGKLARRLLVEMDSEASGGRVG
jgi:acyl-coenzyme A synthetase/AMP-(fatty) acid ligase